MIIRKIEYQSHIFISAMLRSIDILRYHAKLIVLYLNDSNIVLEDCVPAAKKISKKLRLVFSDNPILKEKASEIIPRFKLTLDDLICSIGDQSPTRLEAFSFTNS